MKTALVLGAGGFIGSHLVNRLKSEGYWVRGVDLKTPDFSPSQADHFLLYDLRDPRNVESIMRLSVRHERWAYLPQAFDELIPFDEVYQLAADMGGAGFVFTGEHDADIMHNSAIINLNVAVWATINGVKKIFYSSSACMYPQELQKSQRIAEIEYHEGRSGTLALDESMAYPANPDSEYGWEKLFSERLYLAYARNYGLNVRIARFHNIYGEEGTYKGGREKAPAAMCRKVVESRQYNNFDKNISFNPIEVWGTGEQTRSFLYIDDCIDAVRLLMESDFKEPINIGSEEIISINGLAQMAIDISGKSIQIKNIESNAIGVQGRNSDNTLIRQVLNWEPKYTLRQGLEKTYRWINSQINGL